MTKTLDELIAVAKQALDKTDEKSEDPAKIREHETAKARHDALVEAKDEGFAFKQADLNRIDKKAREEEGGKWKDATQMSSPDELKEAIATVEESLTSDEGEGDEEGDDANVLTRIQSALKERDEAIEGEREERLKFERELRTERVTNRLGEAFKAAGLNEKYLSPAKRLASHDELIEKLMKGEEVDFSAIASSVKEASPVWFEPEPNNDYQGIAPTPNGDPLPELTDQQRAEKAEPVF